MPEVAKERPRLCAKGDSDQLRSDSGAAAYPRYVAHTTALVVIFCQHLLFSARFSASLDWKWAGLVFSLNYKHLGRYSTTSCSFSRDDRACSFSGSFHQGRNWSGKSSAVFPACMWEIPGKFGSYVYNELPESGVWLSLELCVEALWNGVTQTEIRESLPIQSKSPRKRYGFTASSRNPDLLHIFLPHFLGFQLGCTLTK